MKNYYIIIAGIFILLTNYSLFAQPESYSNGYDHKFHSDEIRLPWEATSDKPLIVAKSNSGEYKSFGEKYGDWTFLINRMSGTISKAFGESIQLPGLNQINRENVISASRKFLEDNAGIFKLNSSDFELSRAREINGRWYVDFKQYYEGMEVLLSAVELRIFGNGKITSFSVENYNITDINNKSITPDEAESFACNGIAFNMLTDETEADSKMYVLPYFRSGKTEYHLVYRVKTKTAEPYAIYTSYIDAENGEILWRYNNVINSNSITTHGTVKKRFGQDPFTDQPFADMDIFVNGSSKSTNAEGEAEYDEQDSISVNAAFSGKWAKVSMLSGSPRTTASYASTHKGTEDIDILWDDNNSHAAERNLFYHANWVHDYVKGIDTLLTPMDFQLNLTVSFKGSPNAYSSGQTIGYIGAYLQDTRFPECASILYHEYGHSVNTLLYEAEGATNGMISSSCHEGHADLFSALIQDEPRMGVGAWVSDSNRIIRTLDNSLVYPDDIEADGHHNGMILGGAYWDLRKATSLDFVRKLSHFTKYAIPDDANVGIAFSEWFIETLNTDDDDGNLKNGTPNMLEIIKAFNKHKIGTNLMIQLSFEHNQLSNTMETQQPYDVPFRIYPLGIVGSTPDSVCVYWSIDNFVTKNIAIAQLLDENEGTYLAKIPAQKAGSIVEYYMHAWEPISETAVDLFKSMENVKPFKFLIGYQSIFADNFETNNGWTSGSVSDQATRGKWELGIPNQIDMTLYGYGVLQPGKDHSDEGMYCWVTGPKGTMAQYTQYMPNGRTTLESPDYQIGELFLPLVKYYRWFYNIYGYGYTGYETYWQTDISFDGGQSWISAERTKEPTKLWEEQYIIIHSIMPEEADSFRLRFIFDVPKYTSNPFSLNEGLIDDFEILTVDKSLVSVQDKSKQAAVYPNPFTNETYITFNNGIQPSVLVIYDLPGTKIKEIKQNDFGSSFIWDGTNNLGIRQSPGIYFYNAEYKGNILSGKIVLQ